MPQATAAAAAPLVPAGLLLTGLRRVRRWTRPQLARTLGWKTARVTAVEDGRAHLSAEELQAAVQALGLDPWELDFTREYFRGGGRLPRDGAFDPRWEAFTIALEVGQVMYRFLRLIERAGRTPRAGEVPA
jgi:transcriptional regulator with XRE-family HTH domain